MEKHNPEGGCRAKAIVMRREDGSFHLFSETGNHSHATNKAGIIAEEMKLKMVEIVKKDPTTPVSDAIKAVKTEMAEEFGENEQLLKDITAELGTKRSLEQKLLRVRNKIIGPMPKTRNSFNPEEMLEKLFKDKSKDIVVMDSNKMPDNWKEDLKTNPNSDYNLSKMEELRKHEEAEEEEEKEEGSNEETKEENEADDPEDESMDNKQKRVLAFSSIRQLKLFSKCERGSVDGTFKSICKLWGQMFVWCVKRNGHWIPVVWAWLPDKSLESYKVSVMTVL